MYQIKKQFLLSKRHCSISIVIFLMRSAIHKKTEAGIQRKSKLEGCKPMLEKYLGVMFKKFFSKLLKP